MERVLILGASGLVGKAVSKELEQHYDVYGTYSSHKLEGVNSIYYDLSEENGMVELLNQVQPLKIIYCLRGDFDTQLNRLHDLVDYLLPIGGKLYFCSTANVFDGDTSKSHYQDEQPVAVSDYGKSKIACENFLITSLTKNAVILRLPMIWGKDSPRFNSLRTALFNNEKIDIYTNIFVNHNTDTMLAKQIGFILQNNLEGIFHLGSPDVISHSDFITNLASHLGYDHAQFNEEKGSEEKSFLAVLPKADQLPQTLVLSNAAVIHHLTA